MGTGGSVSKPKSSNTNLNQNNTIKNVFNLNLSYSDYIVLNSKLNYCGSTFLVDTQADISLVKLSAIQTSFDLDNKINTNETIRIKGITQDIINSLGTININFYINNHYIHCLLHVVPNELNIPVDGILGKDFIKHYKCKIDYESMQITIQNENIKLKMPILSGPSDNTIVLPARAEVSREFILNLKSDSLVLDQEILPGVFIPKTVVSANNTILRVMNTTDDVKTVSKNITIKVDELTNYHIFTLDSLKNESSRQDKLLEIISKNNNIELNKNLLQLCKQYADIFALETDKMTVNNFYKQKLRIKDDSPIYVKNYRLPYSQREETRKQVNNLLANGLIEPSLSNYNSPIILVPKKGSSKWRMCIDYRLVNKKLIADKYPLPRIEDILDNLGRTKYFSVLDLFSGFHQIPLEESSRDITSFSTPEGSYRWKVLPFGLNVSPNSFSRMMALAFAGATPLQCFLYMDDIIVIGCSEKHHLSNLKNVFEICRKYNLKLNPLKCQFFKNEVTYLGHKCSDRGISPDDSKSNVIEKYPKPYDKDSTKRFVAFMNYYRKFIPNFAELAKPLNSLTRRKAVFLWTEECEKSFIKLKQALLTPKILHYPDFSKEFIITVDASNIAAGAVLSQNFNENELPIAFASKTFTKGELNKHIIEKELAAIHFAIKHFRPYIYGNHFTVRSDHKPLSYLFALKDPSSKLTRMRLDIEEYNFTVEYIKGKDNVVADALSRITIEELKLKRQTTVLAIQTRSMKQKIILQNPNRNNNEKIECNEKEELYKIKIYEGKVNRGIPKLVVKIKENGQMNYVAYYKRKEIFNFDASNAANANVTLEHNLARLEKEAGKRNIKKLLITNKDILFTLISINKFKESCNKVLKSLILIIIPEPKVIKNDNEKTELLQRYHCDPLYGGHIGQKKLYAKLREHFYWKNMSKDIAKFVRNCHKCLVNKAKVKNLEPLVITDTPQKSFDTIVVDTIGPFKKSNKENVYALTLICDLTKFLITVPIPNKQAETVAKAIFDNCILVFGPMRKMLTDRGTEYVNNLTKELFTLMNMQHAKSTAYHHETLGSIERSHRVFNEYLRAYINENQTDWDEFLKYFTYCYNTTPHTSFDCKYTPFELVFARNPVSHEFLLNGKIDPIYNIDNYALEIKYQLQLANKVAQEFLKRSKENNKKNYDKGINTECFKINDKVVIRVENRNKLQPLYKGPFIIKEIIGANAIIIDENGEIEETVHKNRLNKVVNDVYVLKQLN